MDYTTSLNTNCVKAIREPLTTKPHQLPLYATSSFVFDDLKQGIDLFSGKQEGHTYSRYGNPTLDGVAAKIAALELYHSDINGMALLTSSGMAAIGTVCMALLRPGDTVLTQGNLYGGTTELFRQVLSPMGVHIEMINFEDRSIVEQAFDQHKPKLTYLETPANPTLSCIDLEAIAQLAQHHNSYTVVDNTFSTPYLQRPLLLGIDFVIHSTTKYLNGHGNSIAGAIVGKDITLMKEKVLAQLRLIGTNCNAWDAWLLNNGLKTLALRMERHSENALFIAKWLSDQPQVVRVNYPGLEQHPTHHIAKKQMDNYGGMLSFELKGGQERAINMVNELKIGVMAPTLGDVDTLVLHPASMSHRGIPKEERDSQGITDGLIRLSVGIEDKHDLVYDLEQAIFAAF
jgi:methionine-gamma-lyase